jgi:hypothetical protein
MVVVARLSVVVQMGDRMAYAPAMRATKSCG